MLGFVGAGRAGSALSLALSRAGYPVTAIYSRTPAHARRVAVGTGAAVCASPADVARYSEVLFLTVPDDAIVSVAHRIATSGGFGPGVSVVHASGALNMGVLAEAAARGAPTGVFHPLQAMSGPESAPLLDGAYVGIEGHPDLVPVLFAMADSVGARPLEVSGAAKVPYHIAAVFAANYTLALLAAGSDLMMAAGISEECSLATLLPLARGSLENLERLGAREGLTGPVVRGDRATVARHLEYLREHQPHLEEVYRRLGLLALELAGESFSRRGVREEIQG